MCDDIDMFHLPEKEVNRYETLKAIKSIAEKSSDLSITEMPFGFPAYYTYNVSGDILKIDLFHFESDPFLERPIVENGVRLASLKDIAAMKLNAITSRSTKKDFMDIDELLKDFTLNEMLDFYERRYPYYEKKDVILALCAIHEADSSPTPNVLNGRIWGDVKNYIIAQTKNHINNAIKE